MTPLKSHDILFVGFRRGRDVELLCTDNGLAYIPDPIKPVTPWQKSGGYTLVHVAQATENLVVLRMCGLNVSEVI